MTVTPQVKPALLKRFVATGSADLGPGVAARLDEKRNILFIDQSIYDACNARGKRTLWRCTTTVEFKQ